MYNLLVKYGGWDERTDTIPIQRVLGHTSDEARAGVSDESGALSIKKLIELPTLFLQETVPGEDAVARVGWLSRVSRQDRNYQLRYQFDPAIPAFQNSQLRTFSGALEIEDSEFMRTHWAVKEADLFRELLSNLDPRRRQPRVFRLEDPEVIEPTLVSAMMPFHPNFDRVYAAI